MQKIMDEGLHGLFFVQRSSRANVMITKILIYSYARCVDFGVGSGTL